MNRGSRLQVMVAVPAVIAAVVFLVLTLIAVGRTPATGGVLENTPVKVTQVAGTSVSEVTLSAVAARRIGIATGPVSATRVAAAGVAVTPQKTVPYSAILYDNDGGTWVFVSSRPLVFVRDRVTVADIAGNLAILSQGPAAGTPVVTVGAAELWGAEDGVGGE